MEKRTLIALALSFMVLGFYPVILQKFYPDYYKKGAMTARKNAAVAAKTAVNTPTFLKSVTFVPQEDTVFESKKLKLTLNRKDSGIREISFGEFMDSETKSPIKLLSIKNTGVSPLSILVSSGGDSEGVADYQSSASGQEYSFSATALSGKLKVQKKISWDSGYTGKMEVSFENISSAPLEFQYEVLAGSGITPRHSIDSQYIEANFFSERGDKKSVKHIKESRSGKQTASDGPVEWIAIKDRHFSVVLKPESQGAFSGLVRGLGNHDLSASLVSTPVLLAPGTSLSSRYSLYIGPNELEPLQAAGFEDLVNFGKFDPIAKLLVGALELLHNVFRNYGISIIVLTALINLMLFPLTRVSYMSMKRMQLIQPQMTKLREQHKKNPEKLNKEMMELYKKHKVNPFGGCLPMVVQIPIFISLYVALSKSVILINSGLLWIKDLSSPDRVYLPMTLPFLGDSIHVLPLLMCVAMALQQKFTQIKIEGQDPMMEQQQKMMAVMMPVVFGFIFYQMPSGLVLYWLTNTLLMASYQLKLKNMKLA